MKAVTGSDYVGGTSLSTQQRANDGMGALLQFLMMALPEAAPELELCEGGNCFKAGTQVRMKDGSTKSIQKLKVGEIVRSRDPKTGADVDEPIVRLFVRQVDRVLTLRIADSERFTCTPGHRFFVYKRGVVEAGNLKVGERLIEGDGRTSRTSDTVAITAIDWGTKATASLTSTSPVASGDVPTAELPTTEPSNQDAPTSKPKIETYLELDMSQGKGLFTAWRIEPSAKPVVITRGNRKWVGLIGEVKQGDTINMNQSLVALVTKAEKYVDPHPNEDNTPNANGNVAERVVGWSKHVTDTLLDLRTTDEDVITTPEHPFFVHGRGWVKAGSLHQGDQIETETADKLITVVSTTVEHKQQAVYNLDVENTHTFFVGKDKLLVHNGDCVPEIPEKAWWGTGKAPTQVTPGTRNLTGQYINDFNGRVEPWEAHYDEYGRMIGRTDYNAGNIVHGIPDTHYHTYGYNNGIPYPIANRAPGVFVP